LPILISFCLNLVKGSLQSELNQFFQVKDNQKVPTLKVTASAFCKARKKFSETAFIELNQCVNAVFHEQADLQKWHGFRVLAVDGSKYHLPDSEEIHKAFGGQSNQHTDEVPMALGSCLHDVFHGVVLDARLQPYRSNERTLAYQHLDFTQAGDLVLYDRGYPAFWLFAAHHFHKRDFCMRVKASFNRATKDFVRSGKKQDIVTLTPRDDMIKACQEKGLPFDAMEVRLLRVKTVKGEYVLITSLLDKRRYPIKAFKELYHLRWQIEEGYKKQKSWMEIENFTGKSVLAVKQDFYARVLSQTLTAISIHAAQVYLKPGITKRCHAYKTNFAQALSSMKNTLIHLLFGTINEQEIRRWLQTISQALSIIRPGRSFERKRQSNKTRKFHHSYKRTL